MRALPICKKPVGEGAKRVTMADGVSLALVINIGLALGRAFLLSGPVVQWMSAPNIAGAPLPQPARGFWKAHLSAGRERVEAFLEAERAQLPPWFVVGFGAGIAAWFALDTPTQWLALLAIGSAVALAGFTARGGRAERAAGWFALALVLGCALVWARSAWVAAPRLERPVIAAFDARVERVESLVAKGDVRMTLAPSDAALPPRVRVTVKAEGAPEDLRKGALVRVRARLAPPPPMALPGQLRFRPRRLVPEDRRGRPGARAGRAASRRGATAGSTGCATGWAAISASDCPAIRAGSRPRSPTATRMRSPRTMPKRCGEAGSPICCRSAACTSPPWSAR